MSDNLSVQAELSALSQSAFAAMGFDPALGTVLPSVKDGAPFQCNGAMAAAGALKKKGEKANPRDIAAKIVEALSRHHEFAALEIAGPGFINITPSDALINARAARILADDRTGASLTDSAQTIVIDYGGANVAKPMHVGHLRSAVIGESLKRILRFRGHNVIGDIHMGDWGLQMGHLITELEDEQPGLAYFDAAIVSGYPGVSPVDMEDMARLYPAASAKSKADPNRLERSRVATAELQVGRPGYRALLDHFITESIKALKKGYGDLGVEFDLWKGEAAVDPLIPGMIDDLTAMGITEKDDGALIIRVNDVEPAKEMAPVMLRASSGAVLYHTTDLATLIDRKDQIDPDFVLYVVDQRQALHFEQVFRAAIRAGWYTPEQLYHAGFGTMNGKDGKPFTTRGGGVLKLEDLLSMMHDAASERVRAAGMADKFGEEELEDITQKVGIAALKFADLQNQRMTNYIFDLERFTAFEGKTGPYLLYAAVRIKSILRKADAAGLTPGVIDAVDPAEQKLVLMLDSFETALAVSIDKFAPHILCDHVYKLAQAFSRFYSECPILADETPGDVKASRLALASLTLMQLELCLDLLGMEAPERM